MARKELAVMRTQLNPYLTESTKQFIDKALAYSIAKGKMKDKGNLLLVEGLPNSEKGFSITTYIVVEDGMPKKMNVDVKGLESWERFFLFKIMGEMCKMNSYLTALNENFMNMMDELAAEVFRGITSPAKAKDETLKLAREEELKLSRARMILGRGKRAAEEIIEWIEKGENNPIYAVVDFSPLINLLNDAALLNLMMRNTRKEAIATAQSNLKILNKAISLHEKIKEMTNVIDEALDNLASDIPKLENANEKNAEEIGTFLEIIGSHYATVMLKALERLSELRKELITEIENDERIGSLMESFNHVLKTCSADRVIATLHTATGEKLIPQLETNSVYVEVHDVEKVEGEFSQ